MAMNRPAEVVVSWSGGIDSTALVAQLLRQGHRVHTVALGIYGGAFGARELAARNELLGAMRSLGNWASHEERAAPWVWAFSPDGVEIPRRNRLIIDHLIEHDARAQGMHIGLGEYIGCESWVVRDHVGAADADARALAAYIYDQYGLGVRLWTLADFGESRYKDDRLRLGIEAGVDMCATTNCLTDGPVHCGACYKCIERSVAFWRISYLDTTVYAVDPRAHPAWDAYWSQMSGGEVDSSLARFAPMKMPAPAGT